MQSRHLITTTAAVWGLLTIHQQALAQSACGEETCPPGHTCEVGSYDVCDYECEDAPDGRGDCAATECETQAYTYCQRAACETDADCGGTMVCHTLTATTCQGSAACAPDEDCMPPEPADCTTEEYKQCTPRSELPCETASDCGEGYDCVEAVSCSCSGMASGGSAEPGTTTGAGMAGGSMPSVTPTDTAPTPGASTAAPPVPADGEPLPADALPPDCSCSPSGTNYCQLQEIPCEADSDCPADFNCVASPGTCWEDSEGNSGCSEGSSMCYPEAVPGGGMGPTDPSGGPVPAPGTGEGEEGSAGEPPREDDAAPGDQDSGHDGSLGGIFSLFGCSVKPSAGSATSSSVALIAAGLMSLFVRRRRS